MPVSSLLVHVDNSHPEGQTQLETSIASFEGAGIYQSAPGHIVVVTDTPDSQSDLALIQKIESLDGVISTSIVFTHKEDPAEKTSNNGAPP